MEKVILCRSILGHTCALKRKNESECAVSGHTCALKRKKQSECAVLGHTCALRIVFLASMSYLSSFLS